MDRKSADEQLPPTLHGDLRSADRSTRTRTTEGISNLSRSFNLEAQYLSIHQHG